MRRATKQPSHLLAGRRPVQPVQAQLTDTRKPPHVGKPTAQWVILRPLTGPDRRQHSQSMIGQPGQHIHQHVQRALIRPVQIVHNQDHRPAFAEAGQPAVELKRSITGPRLPRWP
jgi:hypothetical protein